MSREDLEGRLQEPEPSNLDPEEYTRFVSELTRHEAAILKLQEMGQPVPRALQDKYDELVKEAWKRDDALTARQN